MNSAGPRSLRFGAREIVSVGLRYSLWGDVRHRSMKAGWPVFVLGIAALFLFVNCVFALFYMVQPDAIAGSDGSFLRSLFFSIETYTTVGFGDLHPRTTFGHVVVSVEVFVGMLTTAMITALVFVRFTRIGPRILFANVAPVAVHDGQRSLMVRLANERMNEISVAQARMWLSMTYTTAEGSLFRRFDEVTLLRNFSPVFALSWTIIHPIDAGSPLHALDEAELVARELTVTLVIDGQDETTGQTVRARKTYAVEELRFGHRYADILDSSEGRRTVLNYSRFHHTDPEPPAAETAPVSPAPADARVPARADA